MDMGDEGSGIGDYVSGHGDLIDASGAMIGRFDVNTVITRFDGVTEGRQVSAEYSFGDGRDSFLISGNESFQVGGVAAEDRPLTYAVVGGTGAYMGATGECVVSRQGETFDVTCKMFTPAE
ncbi:MAG TPA: hypothetical protein DCQ36_09255 [Actinobacteria bacterium]|jgi:hypothetical protein|nr:hypothetical protein [Actinomycetota bacterium]